MPVEPKRDEAGMTPFDLLRKRVRDAPDAVAVATPYRVATYRKMWSRIERSTARLQAEWSIRPGDTIAYLGCGHLDALVMYFAAARCGALVLPLEHGQLQTRAGALVRQGNVRLLLHDDAIALGTDTFDIACKPLSTLIATACRHRESVTEDTAAVSLLEFAPEDVMPDEATPEAVSAPHGTSAREDGDRLPQPRPRSLDALAAIARAGSAGKRAVTGALFDPAIFGPVVLAALLRGEVLTLLPSPDATR